MLIVILIGFLGFGIDISFTGGYWVSFLDLAPAYAGLLSGFSNSLATVVGFLIPNMVSLIVEDVNSNLYLMNYNTEVKFFFQESKYAWNIVFGTMGIGYTASAVVYSTFGSSKLQPWGSFARISQITTN